MPNINKSSLPFTDVLARGSVITVSCDAAGSALVNITGPNGNVQKSSVGAGAARTYGPFLNDVQVLVAMASGSAEVTESIPDVASTVQAVMNEAGEVTSFSAAGQNIPLGGGGGGSGSGLVTGRTISVGSAAVLTDEGTIVQANSASAIAVTIPNDSTVAWEADSVIAVYQVGAGVASFAQGSGVTLRVPTSYAASVQYDTIFARRVGANEWVVSK